MKKILKLTSNLKLKNSNFANKYKHKKKMMPHVSDLLLLLLVFFFLFFLFFFSFVPFFRLGCHFHEWTMDRCLSYRSCSSLFF